MPIRSGRVGLTLAGAQEQTVRDMWWLDVLGQMRRYGRAGKRRRVKVFGLILEREGPLTRCISIHPVNVQSP